MKQSLFRTTSLACCALLILSTARAARSDEIPPAKEGTFSIVVLPDTQAYTSEQGHKYFISETQWIVENLQSQRIVFVSHVGDIVGENVPETWARAKVAMDRLHGKVPYGFSVGNHDMEESSGDSTLFQQTFPTSRFEQFPWYGGGIKNNANSFQLFSAGGLDFVILHLECNAPDDVLDWANEVLQQQADRRAIITTHAYLGPLDKPRTREGYITDPKGRMRFIKCHGDKGNSPVQMWEKCFRKHENLFLVLCGDQGSTQAMRRTVQGAAGNVVHEVISDYRKGYMRVMRFKPAENKIQVWTYSPYHKLICPGSSIVPDRDQHQFSLDYDMSLHAAGS